MGKKDNRYEQELQMQRKHEEELKSKSIDELKEEAEKQRLINEINGGSGSKIYNAELANKLKSMKTWSIVTIVLCFFIIGLFLYIVLSIVYGIQILTTDWKDNELNDIKTIWGIFCFVILGVISSLIFASIGLKKLLNFNNKKI